MNTVVRPGVIPIGPEGRRFGHPYPIQPAPGPQPLPALAPAPPGYPAATAQYTPLDESLPPHLRRIYAERAQNGMQAYDRPSIDVNVPLGIPPTSPQEEFGYRYEASPTQQHQQQEEGYQQSPPSTSGCKLYHRHTHELAIIAYRDWIGVWTASSIRELPSTAATPAVNTRTISLGLIFTAESSKSREQLSVQSADPAGVHHEPEVGRAAVAVVQGGFQDRGWR